MARITVEDCLKKIDSQYDLVMLAKERTSQLNAGEQALLPPDNDKNTVISLREIGITSDWIGVGVLNFNTFKAFSYSSESLN